MVRRTLILALLGVTFGTLFDWAHVQTGAIAYAHPTPFGIAWWVPLLYIAASVGVGLSHPAADAWFGRKALYPHTPRRLLAGFVGLCAIWFASGALPFASWVVALILAPASMAMWLWLDGTWQGLVIAALTALVGVAVEATLIRAGLFWHTHADLFGVAIWLPWIYVAVSVGYGNVGRALAEREVATRAEGGFGGVGFEGAGTGRARRPRS